MDQNSMKIYYDFILNSIPESIDFNFIPVKSPSIKTLTLTNPTNIPILFKILSIKIHINNHFNQSPTSRRFNLKRSDHIR